MSTMVQLLLLIIAAAAFAFVVGLFIGLTVFSAVSGRADNAATFASFASGFIAFAWFVRLAK